MHEPKGYLTAILAVASVAGVFAALYQHNTVIPVYWSSEAALDSERREFSTWPEITSRIREWLASRPSTVGKPK